MESKQQKQKKNLVFIVTSDADDAGVKKLWVKNWMIMLAVVVVCMIIGGILGYLMYEERMWNNVNQKIEEYKAQIETLEATVKEGEDEKKELESEIANLNNKITIMSDTINQMKVSEEELTAKVEKFAKPTLLPITGSATIEQIKEGDPMSIFTASEGAAIVSTASGTIVEISEDADFGHRVVVDHGNGYQTVYRNQGDVLASVGDSVAQGGTLFLVTSSNTRLGYQIYKDGAYLNPMDMMEISG